MTNDIIKKQDSAIVTQENVWAASPEDKQDLIFPRAKIFQATASEFDIYPNAKPGQIINHITGEELSATFLPFLRFKNFVKFNPRNSQDPTFDPTKAPGEMVWNVSDPHDPRVKECRFGDNGETPTAVEFMNFMSIFDNCEFPVIVSFSKTSYKAGKKLFSMLAFSGGGFSMKFKLTTKKQQNDKGTYFVFDVAPCGKASEDEIAKAKMLFGQFVSKTHEIKPEEEKVTWNE